VKKLVRKVVHLPTCSSTQDLAKEGALGGDNEGLLVWADRQTQGRGRLGRRWSSPLGGLWFSLLLRPKIRPEQVPALVLVAALDWVHVLRSRGVPAQVKWPNDVWAEGKKIGGVLTEMSAQPDRVHWVVMGVGLNVNNRLPLQPLVPAGAVNEWAPSVRSEDLLWDWAARFGASKSRYERDGFSGFRRGFEGVSVLKSQRVTFETPEGVGEGRVLGVDHLGRLRLRVGRKTVVFAGGEVTLVRPK